MEFFDIHIVSIVSSISARKSKCPSSARLGSETSQLGLARAGKFQLELISNILSSMQLKKCAKSLFSAENLNKLFTDNDMEGKWKFSDFAHFFEPHQTF